MIQFSVIFGFCFAEKLRYRTLLVLRKGLRVITPSLWLGATQLDRENVQDRRLEDIDEKTENIEAKMEMAIMPKPSAPRPPPPVAQISTLPRMSRPEQPKLLTPRFPEFVFMPPRSLDPVVYGDRDRETESQRLYREWCEKRLREASFTNYERFENWVAAAEAAKKKEKEEGEKLALQGAVGGGSTSTPDSSTSPSDISLPKSDFWTSDSSSASPVLAGSSGSASSSPRDLSSGAEGSFLTHVSE